MAVVAAVLGIVRANEFYVAGADGGCDDIHLSATLPYGFAAGCELGALVMLVMLMRRASFLDDMKKHAYILTECLMAAGFCAILTGVKLEYDFVNDASIKCSNDRQDMTLDFLFPLLVAAYAVTSVTAGVVGAGVLNGKEKMPEPHDYMAGIAIHIVAFGFAIVAIVTSTSSAETGKAHFKPTGIDFANIQFVVANDPKQVGLLTSDHAGSRLVHNVIAGCIIAASAVFVVNAILEYWYSKDQNSYLTSTRGIKFWSLVVALFVYTGAFVTFMVQSVPTLNPGYNNVWPVLVNAGLLAMTPLANSMHYGNRLAVNR